MPPNQGHAGKYSLDTSAILNTWRRHYPPDVFPTLWQKFDQLIESGSLLASEEVLIELEKKDDEVHRWARERGKMFVPIDGAIQQVVREILRTHPRLVDTRRNRSGADPFVIALARIEDCTVVTYETPSNSPSRPRIPDVCAAMGIRCIGLLELIRELGWRL